MIMDMLSNQRLSVGIALIRSEVISTNNIKLTFNQILISRGWKILLTKNPVLI